MGEVYRVDDEMLQTLDELENYPSLYKRKCVPVTIVTRESFDGQSPYPVDEKDNATGFDCQLFLLQNYQDELLALTFWEKFDAVGNPEHRRFSDIHVEDMHRKWKIL